MSLGSSLSRTTSLAEFVIMCSSVVYGGPKAQQKIDIIKATFFLFKCSEALLK